MWGLHLQIGCLLGFVAMVLALVCKMESDDTAASKLFLCGLACVLFWPIILLVWWRWWRGDREALPFTAEWKLKRETAKYERLIRLDRLRRDMLDAKHRAGAVERDLGGYD